MQTYTILAAKDIQPMLVKVIANTTPKVNPQELLRLRNTKLIHRYYELFEVKRKRFDDVLMYLSTEEFFITPDYILQLIRENQSLLDELYKRN